MVHGNRCEICRRIVPEPKASHKQTKYCDECARCKKRLGSKNSWPADVKAAYMREYMRSYRKVHPRLSTTYVRKHREKLRSCSGKASYLSSPAIPLLFLVIALILSGNLDPHSDSLPVFIAYLELLTVKITGFIVIVLICWKHLKRFWKD